MNRPNDRRRNPTHPHTMMVEARSRRRARRWHDRHPEVRESMRRFAERDAFGLDEAPRPPRAPLSPEEEACEREKEEAYWRDTNRWGIDIEEHPELLAEIQAA